MNLVEIFLTLQNQLRVYHWQTESYAQHVALGDAYENLDGLIDSFMEVYIGKYKRPKADGKFNVSLFSYDSNINTVIDKCVTVLTTELPKALDDKDTDLLNIRDEMLAVINKLKYLMTLK